MRIKEVGYIVERLADRFRDLGGQMAVQEAAHKTALSELSASFNARTASDEHRMENLREEIIRLNDAHGRTMVERDALRTEVAELKRQLKPQTPKHPVKVGDWVRRLVPLPGSDAVTVAEVVRVEDDTSEIEVKRIDGLRVVWFAGNCEPCDPPATHDTEAGKAAAAAAVKTEPVADEIKVGDVVEVFQSTASCTFKTDIGTRGTVLQLDDSCVDTAPLDGFLAPKWGHVALCDVRKVTT